MKTLAISLILACFVQTALARMPATAIVRPASELVLRNNSFAAELLRIVASSTTSQWNSTSLLNNIPNFTSATEEGYIPTITEMEEMLIKLEKFDLKDTDVAELRSVYDEAVRQGLISALNNGTALKIAGNVSDEYAEAVGEYASLLALEIQKEGIKGIFVAIAEIIGEGDIQSLQGSLAEERDSGHAAMQTGEAMDALLGKYTQETEVTGANTEVENTELGELTTSTGEQLPAAAMEFGLLMKEVIVRRSLSQKEFCAKLGISISACEYYITFQGVPRLNTLSSKIIPALTSLGVDEKAVRSAWERADAAFTEVATTKPTPTETPIAPTESVPAKELEDDGLTLKQLISQHREILQQKEQQQQRGEVSEAMVQIVRVAQTVLEELLASQAEATAQLKDKMEMENIGWEEIAKYRATGLTPRRTVKDIIGDVSNDPLHADMYAKLLAGLAENSEQAKILLEQYFSGERALSEEELLQVCLHTACTVAVRPMLAVERVLDMSKEVTDKIGVTDELSKEELEVLVAALAVYQGKSQVTAEVRGEVVEPTDAKHDADEAEQKRLAAEEQERLAAEEQERLAAEKRKADAEVKKKQKMEKDTYEPIIRELMEINNLASEGKDKVDSTRKIRQFLSKMGFNDAPDGGNHAKMKSPEGKELSIGSQTNELGAVFVSELVKQARSIRFMEVLAAAGDLEVVKVKLDLLLNYVDRKLAEADEESPEKENLLKLQRALNETYALLTERQ